ncbi:hypothetical protein DN051_44095 (plasmid) [Streptomyces cadmiisoli]|uniref:Peptidoglycan-binding protein n=2 Tax=Streptomyces cadmiisoli TaxID=2184053 RepID=A0A2Z4JEM4_9ACTN|nr:hypothetical protein DN051_44095 [Streptomyces cadmiisoli]
MFMSVLVLGGVVGGVYGTAALSEHGEAQNPKAASVPSAETISVKRMDLSNDETVPGALGFGPPTSVKSAGKGTVTRLPETGSEASRGKPLYWVDDRPVMVFYGDTPLFRKLDEPGTVGRDVTVLAENLRALGYDIDRPVPGEERRAPKTAKGATVGTELTSSLLAALERWQRDTGQKQTGTLDVGQIVVLPGTARVNSLTAQLGDPVPGEVLTVTSARRSVGIKVPAQSASSIHQGDKVSITLPDTRIVPGTVVLVATEVQGGGSDEGTEGIDTTPTLQITVEPDEGDAVAHLDAASVQVSFATQKRKDVLAVPVGALLALREGGYAVQLPDGRLVGVETGLIARGLVEVSGSGIKEGDRVVTAS